MITRDMLINAVEDSLSDGIKQMGSVFVMGLIEGEKTEDLLARFKIGLAQEIAAHEKMAQAVDAYFSQTEATKDSENE